MMNDHALGGWLTYLLFASQFHQYMMSSAVNGTPSDHFKPSRSVIVQTRLSADGSTLLATCALTGYPSGDQCVRKDALRRKLIVSTSVVAFVANRIHVPPYLPMPSGPSMTTGSLGMRSASGRRSPCLTSAVKIGDSFFGATCVST